VRSVSVAIRVLLADYHVIVSQGVEALLEQRFDIIGAVKDGRALVDAVEKLSPDVVVTELSMPGLDGLEAIRQINKSKPGTLLIVLTMHAQPNLAAEALKAGASAYLLKTSAVDELETAIGEALKGRTYVASLIAKEVLSLLITGGASGVDPLTPRQREVLQLIAEGRTMKQVASILRISRRTAETHKYRMMQALGYKTMADLIRYAIESDSVCH
jgi:DNA-binding NarL/FixJ family response regulator